MSNHGNASPEEIRKVAYITIKNFFDSIRNNTKFAVEISEAAEDELVRKTITHHSQHLKLHNLKQRHVDVYKLLAWVGCNTLELIKESQLDASDFQFKQVTMVLVNLMAGHLKADRGIALEKKTRRLLAKSLYEEKYGNPDHGIWMNGLFIAFHTAIKACNLKVKRND